MPTTLRLRWTGKRSEHILLNVIHRGPRDLDLKLIGTDFEKLYSGKVKDSSAKSLQASNFTGNLEEWKSILGLALRHLRPSGTLPEHLQGIQAVGAIDGSTLTVTIQRRIDDITQRLGTIKLEETDEEVNTLEWADQATAASDDLRSQLETLQSSVASQQKQITRLTNELDNLIRAKKEHEDELFSKFAALLNAKKLKIRDQQRLLAGAQVDHDAAQEVNDARSRTARREPGASRKGKRKANDAPKPTQDGDTEDEDDEETDLGTANGEDDEEERRRQETPETDDEDIAEAELGGSVDGAGTTTQPDDSQTTRRVVERQKASESQSSRSAPTRTAQGSSQRMKLDESPPGRRMRGREAAAKQRTPPPTSNAPVEDEDDETEDEL
ncbi:hypothetical protein AC578_8593 [Lecanosticta acicola]|uniref:XRCC4 coiled-coil domain-containing protein n=1 Tax=Lecanosticta acicola TaxID=111012 RepID=A0AAI8YTI1_9PEZI|nr:hypothetical protein AC578_8593 [Lecanosticta acicola]